MSDLVPFSARGSSRTPPENLDLQAPDDQKSATEFVGVREYFGMVRRHWYVVLGILFVSTAYTANQTMKERPYYRASSTVRLVDSRRAIAGGMAGSGGTESQFSGMSDPIESQIQVLMSRAVASVAVDLKGLRLIPAEGQAFVEEVTDIKVADSATATSIALSFSQAGYTIRSGDRTVSAIYGVPAAIDGVSLTVSKQPATASTVFDVVSKESAVGHALGGFSPSSRSKTDILDLSYTGSEPWEAKRIANAMAEAFQVQNAQNAQQISRRRRRFLEDQLRQTDSMLSGASGAYTSYRSGRQVFSSAARAGAQEAGIIQIDTKRSELDAEKRTATSLIAQAKASPQNMSGSLRVLISQPGIGSNPVVQQLYGQLTQYEKARDDLLTAGQAPSNPDVVALSSLIPATASKMIDAVESHIQSIDAQIQAMDRQRATGATAISAAPAIEAREMQLNQRVQSVQSTADQLRTELQQAKMAEAVEAGQVEIVQLSESPGYQIPTKGRRKLVIGMIVGLMLGCGAAVLVDGLNNSIRRRSDIERLLKVPGLAVIPRLSTSNGAGNRMMRALPSLKSNNKSPSGKHEEDLVTVTDVRSAGAEAYRTLRTNLMFSQAVQALRSLVVTSAGPGEGKTTTSANLAVSFAQQGMRILLIDCDLRRARLH
ncbi:MAG: hypothetical protein M3Q09_10530, partial [Gemmatimonadota bacterium]|nr:hypothetical protein [Gemmatimonadota bacterium]